MGCNENNACPEFIPVVFYAEIVVIPLFWPLLAPAHTHTVLERIELFN